ncbi:MAG: hypothetical protein EHM41_07335 [Chloroflexi bacterium]|nr:MAG: hypothetical protein EHM41_07335 [Chloroflexota bacterium]
MPEYMNVIPKFSHPPERVVSLVPSLTESMFDLGLGSTLVGITDYCVYPSPDVDSLPRLGGPKNPRVEDIVSLKPQLVLANQEENTPAVVEALQDAGIDVWVSFPKTAREAVETLWELVEIFRNLQAGFRIHTLEYSLEWAERALETINPMRTFCPIWQDIAGDGTRWWMVFNRSTYAHDVLRLAGGLNIFAGRERRYPLDADLGRIEPQSLGDRDVRYPRITLEEIFQLEPEVILLPSEPFPYDESHLEILREQFAGTPAVEKDQVYRIDGSLITWHGTRLAKALRELPVIFQG